MKFILRVFICAIVFLDFSPVKIYAFGQYNPDLDGLASHWESLPITVVVDGGTLFGKGNGLELVQSAIEVWNSVSGVPVLFSTPQETTEEDYNLTNISIWDVADDTVRVVFDEDGEIISYLGIDPTSGILGMGFSFPDVSGAATGGILIINGHSSASDYDDLKGIIVHEFGHVLGLTHTPVGFGGLVPLPESRRPTMYPFAGQNEPSSLEPDDIAGIRSIYGE